MAKYTKQSKEALKIVQDHIKKEPPKKLIEYTVTVDLQFTLTATKENIKEVAKTIAREKIADENITITY